MAGISNDRYGNPTGGEFAFITMNNKVDPSRLSVDKGECSAIINMFTDARGRAYTRPGYSSVDSGNYIGSWSNGKFAYVIKDSALYYFNGTELTFVTLVTPNIDYDFCEINDIVVFSNGDDYKILEGTNELSIDLPLQMPEFKVKPHAGTSLEFYNGRLYIASGNTLYCTDPFTVEWMDERFNVVDIYDDPITMVKSVDSGIFVSTTRQLIYLGGVDPFINEGFNRSSLLSYGIIKGTAIKTFGDAFPVAGIDGEIIVAATSKGIVILANGGKYNNISFDKISYGYGDRGSGLYYENNGSNFYIVSLPQNYSEENKYIIPTFNVDKQEV